ncbi:MAG: hypothetical protein HY332_18435 [Chloroflexi bacterium]|nr:hypothetical protein [Chloroflexota bacterium]
MAERPNMVSLDRFLEGEPPPPKRPVNWAKVIGGSAIALIIVVAVAYGAVMLQGQADQIWSSVGSIDQRTQLK